MQDAAIDVNRLVIGEPVRLFAEKHLAFAGKDVENLLSIVLMRRMRPRARAHFRDVEMQSFPIRALFKDKTAQ